MEFLCRLLIFRWNYESWPGDDDGFDQYNENSFETHANNWKKADKSNIEIE